MSHATRLAARFLYVQAVQDVHVVLGTAICASFRELGSSLPLPGASTHSTLPSQVPNVKNAGWPRRMCGCDT